MADLWILDKNDSLLTILSSDADNACVFWDAIFREELNKSSTFQFTCDATHKDSKHVAKLNQVVFKDNDGFFRLFKIREIDRTNGENQAGKIAQCEPAELELLEKIIDDIRPYNTTQLDALERALVGTRWKANVTASNGINSTNFYHISVYDAITDIINTWGGELKFTVTFDTKTNQIIERVVNIVQRRGADNGTRFEVGYNIEEIHETEMAYPVSALWGWGGSVEDENGNDSRFIDFADVVWSKANGDPVDKPKGQKWVEYPPAKEKFGLRTPDGVINVEGKWQDENIKDPVELLQKTYHHLVNEASQIQTNYSFEVALTNETVELGDTCLALDRTIPDPIEFFGRVIALEYDVSDQTFPATVEMGQFLSVYEPDTRLDQIEDKIREIEQGRDIVVDDGSFPDTKPPTPKNVVAKGLFEKVAIDWYYETFSYIAAYEVYGSQVKDFTPDTVNFSNRLWRGKAGGWIHEAAVNQVWYYRIRSVNTRGTPSDFTAQFSAATTRIGTNHIEDQSITNAKIKDLSADKITAGIINGITIRGSLIQGARFEASNQNEDFQSWLENGTFYQYTRDDDTSIYNKLSITSGMIEQETGSFYWDGSSMNGVHTTVHIGNGKLEVRGVAGQNQQGGIPTIDMYSEKITNNPDNAFHDRDNVSRYRMNRINSQGNQEILSVISGSHSFLDDTIYETNYNTFDPNGVYMAYFGGDKSHFRFKPVNFDVVASGGMRLKAPKQIFVDTNKMILPPTTTIKGGDTSYNSYPAVFGSLKKVITDTYGGLQHCLGIFVDQTTIPMPINGGAYGYNSTEYKFSGDGEYNQIENCFAVFAQPFGAYSNAVTVGIENQSSSGFKIFMRGTGATSNIEGRDIIVRLLVLYEVA
ncbi:phage tail spike protein [Bacillus licheniformis]